MDYELNNELNNNELKDYVQKMESSCPSKDNLYFTRYIISSITCNVLLAGRARL